MNALSDVLIRHAARYPLWRAQDVLKLLYQNEFGCEHLVADREQSLARLMSEWALCEFLPGMPPLEDIGNGFSRMHLAACRASGVSPARAHEAFFQSAQIKPGTLERFLAKSALAQGRFPTLAITRALSQWQDAGRPLFSHSPEYRDAYRPAYRVVKTELGKRLLD